MMTSQANHTLEVAPATRPRNRANAGAAIAAAILIATVAIQSAQAAGSIDVQKSRLTILVSKSGLFSALGDNHTIAAPILSGAISEATPLSVSLVVNTADLLVRDPNLSTDKRDEVRKRMLGDEVLDAARFQTITFESTKIEPSGEHQWRVSGRLTIHGVTRIVTFATVHVNDRYRGRVEIRQRDFGITPISIAGGTVKVKDELTIEFEIVPA